MNPADNLIQAAELFKERGAVYKDNYRRAGEIFMWLCPEGINVNDAETYNRMAILMQIINKLLRYTLNFDKGHLDSLQDMSVYCMILKELDEEYLNDAS
jgi:hypothetical protein